MLNVLWPVFIIVSCIYAIFTGKVEQINTSIFSSLESVVQLSITLLGTICLWNGIMNIAINTSLIEKLVFFFKPLLKYLFPEIYQDEKIRKEISMNIVANMLGLGNAATPLGLKAMKSMQEKNKKTDTLSNAMLMFIVINTASIQMIPTTVIAIRSSLGSQNPTATIVPIWISSACSIIVAILITKFLIKVGK